MIINGETVSEETAKTKQEAKQLALEKAIHNFEMDEQVILTH